MKFDIVKIIELLQNYGYELDIMPTGENRVRIKVRSEECYSSKTIDLSAEDRYSGDPNDIVYNRILEIIMTLKTFEYGYVPMHCSCGGTLYDMSDGKGPHFTCMRCAKTYPKWKLKYDQIGVNPMTGWIFPMVKPQYGEVSE